MNAPPQSNNATNQTAPKTGWSFDSPDTQNIALGRESRREKFSTRILTPLGQEGVDYERIVVAPDRKPLLLAAIDYVKHRGNVPTQPNRFSWFINGKLHNFNEFQLSAKLDSADRFTILLSDSLPEISALHVMAKKGRYLLDSATREPNGAWKLNLPYQKYGRAQILLQHDSGVAITNFVISLSDCL